MLKSKTILISEGITLLLIILISTLSLPLSYGIQLALGLLLAYAIPRIAYSRQSHYCTAGNAVLIVLWLMLSVLTVYYVGRCTMWGKLSLDSPHLWGDAHRYWRVAESIYHDTPYNRQYPYLGLPAMIMASWALFGKSLISPVCVNVCLSISSVVLMGNVTIHLLANRTRQSSAWIASMAMAATSSLFYLLSHSMQVLKEPLLAFGVATCALAVARIIERRDSLNLFAWREIGIFSIGALIMAATRPPYVWAMIAGALLCAIYRRPRASALAMTAIGVALYGAADFISQWFTPRVLLAVVDSSHAEGFSSQFIVGPSQIPYYNIIGDYFTYPWWKKLLLLPFTSMVQYVIPFPWTFGSINIDEVFPRISLGAYIVGGTALFYIFFLSWRRNSLLTTFTAWAILCFVMPAYAVAGSVPRYVTPFQLLFVPMAIYVFAMLVEHQHRKKFTIFAVAYALVLAVTLAACYSAQADAMSQYA